MSRTVKWVVSAAASRTHNLKYSVDPVYQFYLIQHKIFKNFGLGTIIESNALILLVKVLKKRYLRV